ncbi:phosphoglycerate mutase-like protein [Mycena vitilis]|nr:phosphoglycerate mutase-like protein [Mycena vitilis]
MSTIGASFTFIRHGESTDNLRAVWAGWSDATLTNHGMNQAQAVGASLSETQFTTIFSSPLKRAHMTAEAIQSQQQDGTPPLVTSPLFREQHFGAAEGKPSTRKRDPDMPLSDQFNEGIYPSALSRSEKFPEGESADEVQDRARKGWEEILWPHVREAAKECNGNVHVAVVSHGIFIKEIVRALAKRDHAVDISACNYQWLRNTAWARVVIEVKAFHKGEESESSMRVQLTHFNQCNHLANVKRQKGGIGREAYEPRQQDIRKFFGAKDGRSSRGL